MFSVNVNILSGEKSVEKLNLDNSKKILITTDKVLNSLGSTKPVVNLLSSKNIAFEVFEDIEPEPSLETVTKMLQVLISKDIDTVIAVGGGSVIDASKGMILFALETYKNQGLNKCKPLFIAIPTTSGTGSEVTEYSVLTDKADHRKIPLVSKEMLPDIAVLDPDFTMTVPARITAETGMDVLTHAIESYVSRKANTFTQAYAKVAIEKVFSYLSKVCEKGDFIEGRVAMHEASCMAGIAFNASGLGLVHAMAHSLGALFKQPHGRANALILPHVIAYNGSKCQIAAKKYTDIVKSLGFNPKSDAEGVIILSEAVKALNKAVGVNAKVTDYGVDKAEFERNIRKLAEMSTQDVTIKTNPVRVPAEDIVCIYKNLI